MSGQKLLDPTTYIPIPLPVVLLLSLRKERSLRVFENRLLSRIFGPKRAEVRG